MGPSSTGDEVGGTPLTIPGLEGGSSIFCSGEEAIRLTIRNAAAGVVVAFTGRFLAADSGRVNVLNQPLTPATDRSASTINVPLGVGWLLDWSLVVTAGTPLVGQTFGIVQLVRGLASSALELSTLGAGYVTTKQRLFGPDGPTRGFLEDGGALRSITGTLPGAGVEISETVPTGARWLLVAFEADLTTSAAAANRVPELTIDDGANVYARSPVNQNEVASQTWRNSFQQGIPQIFDSTRFRVLQPLGCDLVLGAGHRIKTVTVGIQAGDQWAAPQYLVVERMEG